jgi:hypothetical protein
VADQQRTVTIHKADGWDDYMSEHHGDTAFQNAMGYLACYMWSRWFDNVMITCTLGSSGQNPEIGASYTHTEYRTENGFRTAEVTDRYFICAIFDPQQSPTDQHNGRLASFSFHS